jgi:DnaJ like chaperone protein
MNWWGKLIGTGVGLLGGPIGAIAGAAIGHLYDDGDPTPQNEQKARILYLTYFFSCAAKLSKADGHVSAGEIKVVESLIKRMCLSSKAAEFAKNVFRKAKESKYPIENDLREVGQLIGYDATVAQSFLSGLFEIALSNGKKIHERQGKILLTGEKLLRLPNGLIRSWLRGGHAKTNYNSQENSISLVEAYNVLGLNENCKVSEIKPAYRRKAADFHPDKLKSKNLPEEFTSFANDQLAKINQAHHILCQTHNI